METKPKRGPDRRFKCGGVTASVWVNDTGENGHGLRAKIQLLSHYCNDTGEWQTTQSFNVNDLPKIMAVVRKAHEYLELTAEEPEQNVQEPQPRGAKEKVVTEGVQ